MENLRLTRNAIMPVGYDTLELLSLTAGEMIRHGEPTASEGAHRNVQRRTPRRILDLCCGCGIQGIFALKCFEGSKICPHNTCSCVLVSVDINDRAMHFVGANLALNEVCVTNPDENHDDESNSAVAVCGDLYHPLAQQHPDNKYDWILCNPPFVATPLCPVGPQTISPALYAVGGGVDGMDCLRRILKHLFTYLSNDNPQAMAFLVTEVPNVEDSCMMLQSMLFQSEQDKARIRVVYVEEDVETVEEYSRERESEAGNVLGSISEADSLSQVCRDWSSPMLEVGIRNRALVLISFARMPSGHNNNEKQMGLYAFSSATDDPGKDRTCDVDPIDEEDALLRPQGMAFSRAALLF
jgi:methylase of polypeptide subunit release factors